MRNLIFILATAFIFSSCTHNGPVRETASTAATLSPTLENIRAREVGLVTEPQHMTQFYGSTQKAARSVLIMHGLHESPAYMQNLSKAYEEKGYNVISLRLSGHHTIHRDGLNQVRFSEWLQDAEQGFKAAQEVGEQVEVAGYSTGGTLAMELALKYPNQIKKLTMIAPALALNDKVFVSGLVLGQTNLDGRKICQAGRKKDSFLCRILKASDKQIAPMLNEGLLPSAAAGFQVQGLIDAIAERTLGPRPEATDGMNSDEDYYKRLSRTYGQLKVPMVMVNSEKDGVVNWKFNQKFAENYQGAKKAILLYPPNLNISHLAMNKTQMNAFKNNPELVNTAFGEILQAIDSVDAK